ncbi:MAG: tetratricopeptide repeat protein, partial [Bdellovibrionales bacterium]|nr:tetratricopeptide repeat protein [Bdellovibrionales bacterium]
IQVIESNKNWWLTGGQKNLLQKTYIAAQLELFDFHRKNRRSLAWDAFDKLMAHKDLLGNEDMADVLKKAGELAFLQQNLIVAYDYLTRSLRLKKDLDVNNRLSSIRELLIEKKLLTPKTLNDNKRVNVSLEASEKENQTYEQMKVALAAGDLVPAVEDGIKLINEYPSGERAKEATKKLIQIYMNISTKKGDQYQPLQTRLFNQMQKTNGREMYRWGKYLFTKSYHDEAQKFFAVAVSKLEDDKSIAEIYSYYGQSLVYTGDYKRALEAFIKATIYSAGTDISERTMFLLGLTYFQLGQLSESAAQFERLIAARQNSDYEVRSYYWLWRSLQSLDKQRAIDVGTTLFTKYPLTYYGLRARFEIQGEDLRWLEKSGVNEQSLSVQLTDFEYLAWEKAKWLLAAGWF